MSKLKLDEDEVQGFTLNPDEKKAFGEYTNVEVVGSSEYLDNHDFTSDDEFNIEENYEFVQKLTLEQPDENIAKIMEAENIIKSTAKLYMDEDFINEFKKEEENLRAFLRKFSAELDITMNMTRSERDKLFAISNHLFNNYQKKLNTLDYSFPLTRKEYKFIYTVFNKLEYDQNEVFQMGELNKSYLELHKDIVKNLPKGIEEIPTYINVNMLIILYHLISKYKVKGITGEFYNFQTVLLKIGERIKLFNAYNVIVERLSNEFAQWVSTLTSLDDDLISVDTNVKPPVQEN